MKSTPWIKPLVLSLSTIFATGLVHATEFQFQAESEYRPTPNMDFACIDDDKMLITEQMDSKRKKTDKVASNAKIADCLSAYGDFVLRDGGKASKEFAQKFKEFGRQYDLDSRRYTPLSAFKIKVPQKADLNVSEGKTCFDVANHTPRTRKNQILAMKKQIEIAADFLVHHHVKSAGARNSWFFNLVQVEICSRSALNSRDLLYSRHKLHIGVSGTSTQSLSDIDTGWQNDNIIRRVQHTWWTSFYTALPFGEKFRKFWVYYNSGKEGVLMDKVAEKWELVLNPTNLLRSSIVIDLVGGVSRLLKGKGVISQLNDRILEGKDIPVQENDANMIQKEMLRISSTGPGLEQEKKKIQAMDTSDPGNQELLKQMYSDYLRTMDDRFTVIEMLETGVGESIKMLNPLYNPAATNTFKWNDRDGTTIIGATVFNDKDIGVKAFIGNLIPTGSLSVLRFSPTVTKQVQQRQDSLKGSAIVIPKDEALAKEIAKIDRKKLELLKCTNQDSDEICKIKTLSVKLTDDAMVYKDDDVVVIKYVPGMNYDLNTDAAFTLVGASLNLIDDVDVLGAIRLPKLDSGMVQRYSLAKAIGYRLNDAKLHRH